MRQQLIFTATEARKNFFNLLQRVENGREIIIKKRGREFHFKLTLLNNDKTTEKIRAFNQIMTLNIPTPSIKKLKKILSSRFDVCKK